jgi:hypothetical protein
MDSITIVNSPTRETTHSPAISGNHLDAIQPARHLHAALFRLYARTLTQTLNNPSRGQAQTMADAQTTTKQPTLQGTNFAELVSSDWLAAHPTHSLEDSRLYKCPCLPVQVLRPVKSLQLYRIQRTKSRERVDSDSCPDAKPEDKEQS